MVLFYHIFDILILMFHFPGVYKYPAHIVLWVCDDFFSEMTQLRRAGRKTVKHSFCFSDSKSDADIALNLERYHRAIADAWYLKSHVTILMLLQNFFFVERRSIAWQLEKLLQTRPGLRDDVLGVNGEIVLSGMLSCSQGSIFNSWPWTAMVVC